MTTANPFRGGKWKGHIWHLQAFLGESSEEPPPDWWESLAQARREIEDSGMGPAPLHHHPFEAGSNPPSHPDAEVGSQLAPPTQVPPPPPQPTTGALVQVPAAKGFSLWLPVAMETPPELASSNEEKGRDTGEDHREGVMGAPPPRGCFARHTSDGPWHWLLGPLVEFCPPGSIMRHFANEERAGKAVASGCPQR